MLKESVTIKEVVDFLNDALNTDSKAITELFFDRKNVMFIWQIMKQFNVE